MQQPTIDVFNFDVEEEIFVDDDDDDSGPEIVIESFFRNVESDTIPSYNLIANTNPIRLSKNDLHTLVDQFKPTYDNFEKYICYLFNSPYKQEFILDFVCSWYVQNPNNNVETIQEFCAENFTPRKDNNWFFVIVNGLPTLQRNLILEKYFTNTVNDSECIDISHPLTFTSMKLQNDYRKRDGFGIRVGDFITDLKKVTVYIDNMSMYIMKVKSSKLRKAEIKFMNPSMFKEKMKEFKLGTIEAGKKTKDITAWDVISEGTNKNFITIEEMVFYDENPKTFNLFQGYEFDQVEEVELELIRPFIDHVYNIICSRNNDLYKYLMYWIGYLFQDPKAKTQVAIVLTGAEGTGKTTFTEVLCHLLGNYANDNAKIDEITGRFNNILMSKKLLVCNEVKSFISNKSYDSDRMKTLITESNVDINIKFKDTIHQENVANFIFVSNNFAPIYISENDRRYLVIEVSSERRVDLAYFSALKETFTEDFYKNLLTFIMKINLQGWNRLNIPMTSAKQAIIDFCKSPYQTFIQAFVIRFRDGFPKKEAFTTYKNWCEENGFNHGTQQDFRLGMLKYCADAKQQNGPSTYLLKQENYQYFNIEDEEAWFE